MKLSFTTTTLTMALLSSGSHAFTTPSQGRAMAFMPHTASVSRLSMTAHTPEEQARADDEIEKLRSMAAKLRAEASALEAERAEELAQAAERVFTKFDLDGDGEISVAELKEGLEKALKTELPEKRVQKLMEDFDVSGDGKLQIDEFVGVDKFRNKLEALAREEKAAAREAAQRAMIEDETARVLQAQIELINDKAPSGTDRILSVLPYLFPLMDGLQFGRYLFGNSDNPVIAILAILYTIYRSIPLSGFVAFFALSFLSNNVSINRLIRYNMQQAIFLDIALFFPGLLAAFYALVAGGGGVQLPEAVTVLGTDAVFGALILVLTYASVSSLLGITPDKIPFISDAVTARMPSVDMFDVTKLPRKDDDKKDKN